MYGCGTKSLILNLNYPFSFDGTPAVGEYDLQSVLAHEFGHVLGFTHQYDGVCTDGIDPPPVVPACSADFNRETMGGSFGTGVGETCLRDIEPNDGDSAN